MLISWNWLGRHIDLDGLDPRTIGEQFTLKVAELDEVYPVGNGLDEVLTARVLAVEPHQDAKKLSIVEICDGKNQHQLICGAPNVRNAINKVVAWVQPGSTLPDGTAIKVAEIRGVVSHGMLASEQELGLSEEHDGILVLPEDTPVGQRLGDAIPIEDWVWEVDNKAITHRADLWGHIGIAREVSMLTGRPLKVTAPEVAFGDEHPVQLDTEIPEGCLRYLCTRIDGVEVQPSPIWLQRLLVATGIRPISNVVDATNYVMLDTGNPLHAFDTQALRQNAIRIIRTQDEVSVTTLDEQERVIQADTLLICDGEGPVAVAGVMGCGNSQISDTTTSLTLESACFDAELVRKSSLALGLRTESSARFEKALAPETARLAALSFCSLLTELSPNLRLDYRLLDAYPHPPEPRAIDLSLAYASQRLGQTLSAETAVRIFESLGLETSKAGDILSVKVPFWRAGRDLQHREDLVEELGRSIGYYAIPPVSPTVEVSRPSRRFDKRQESVARRLMSLEAGYHEVLSYSFAHGPTVERLDEEGESGLALANPISSEWLHMRKSLMPNLLKMAGENRRYYNTFKLFEIGRTFEEVSTGLGAQPRRLGWVGIYDGEPTLAEQYLIEQRAVITRFFESLNYKNYRFVSGVKGFPYEARWMHPNRSLTIEVDGRSVGYLGTLHPKTARRFENLGTQVWLGELDLDALTQPQETVTLFKPLPKYPAIPFDLSLEVPVKMRAAALLDLVREHFKECDIFDAVELFSVFVIDETRKSLSLRFRFRSEARSLSDEEVNPLMDNLIEVFQQVHHIGLRAE